jgi:hypothetical protein
MLQIRKILWGEHERSPFQRFCNSTLLVIFFGNVSQTGEMTFISKCNIVHSKSPEHICYLKLRQ